MRAESPTANTLFHKVKFGIRKAFIVLFEMTCTTKSMSSVQMGKRLEIRQQTAWYFMQKVRKAMASSELHPITGKAEVDEFTVGGKETGKQGRSYKTNKKKAVLAIELGEGRKIFRAIIRKIEDYSAKSIQEIFDKHIDKEAVIRTDKWSAYKKLSKEYKIWRQKSNQGKNFHEIHIVIMQLKSWIRGIHSHVSHKYAQSYFDEFCYRFNRSFIKDKIFPNIVKRMVAHKPTPYLICHET